MVAVEMAIVREDARQRYGGKKWLEWPCWWWRGKVGRTDKDRAHRERQSSYPALVPSPSRLVGVVFFGCQSRASHCHFHSNRIFTHGFTPHAPPYPLYVNRMPVTDFSDCRRNIRRYSITLILPLRKRKREYLACAARIQVHIMKHNCHKTLTFVNAKACR
jgi:hypothetical protein